MISYLTYLLAGRVFICLKVGLDEKHLILCKTKESPGNRVGTVELVEGGALQAGDGGEGEGQHRHQKKKQHHFPEKQHQSSKSVIVIVKLQHLGRLVDCLNWIGGDI